jgi:hypothetical protein
MYGNNNSWGHAQKHVLHVNQSKIGPMANKIAFSYTLRSHEIFLVTENFGNLSRETVAPKRGSKRFHEIFLKDKKYIKNS